jgi:hypothetical protein
VRAAKQLADLTYVTEEGGQLVWHIVQAKTAYQLPTAAELAEADETLRTRVVPETSEQELQEAITGIADDPEKIKQAAFLTGLIEKATGIPGSAPWVVFVVVFCMALKADPDVVNAIALALAVLAVMQTTKPGD